MARESDGPRQSLIHCVAATDEILRALAKVESETELRTLLEMVTRELGFRHYALIHHDDLREKPPDRVKLLDYPKVIEHRIIDEVTWRRDPVIRACNFASQAFLWSELPAIIELDRRDRACIEAGKQVGLNVGITVPYHLLGECIGSCTFAGMRWPNRIARLLGMTQIVGVFAFQAARRLLRLEQKPAPSPRLHPRPRDCVALVGNGLSNKEIARALALAPRTVDGYLTEARKLFGVHDRTELVAAAMAAGEVGLHELVKRQPE